MRVLFLQNVKGHGEKGQIKDINEGYARNFLLPKKLAVLATQEVLAGLRRDLRLQEEALARGRHQSKKLAGLIAKQKTFTLHAPVNPKGFLFAPVREGDVAKLVNKHFPGAVTPKQIIFTDKINSLGGFPVKVDLGGGVTVTISLVIVLA